MEKGVITRIIVWGSTAAVLIALAISGLVSFNNGYGQIGSVMKETKPVAEAFNNLEGLDKYSNIGINITAKAKGNSVIVYYKSSIANASYEFAYLESSKTIKFKYNSSDSTLSTLIVKFMIDAVSTLNGYDEGAVFEKYSLDNFENTTVEDGVNITKSNNYVIVEINIKKSILDSNYDPTPLEEEYFIGLESAKEITDNIESNSSISYSANGITLHINMYETYYSIFIKDDIKQIYSADLYKSVQSIIEALSGEDILNEFTTNYKEFSSNYNEGNITVVLDSQGANSYTEFALKTKIAQIDVKLKSQ